MKYKKVEFQSLLFNVNKPSRYIDHEINAYHKEPNPETVNFCLAFPDVYEVGMSHLGLKILYSILNDTNDAMADRVYAPWPDFGDGLKEHNIPLFAVESKVAVADFDVLGFTLQTELNFSNILYMLDLAKIPLESKNRGEDDPIVIAGGPCATNPGTLSPFIDAFLIGEGEEAIIEIKDAIKTSKNGNRIDKLKALAMIEGMYVPTHPRTPLLHAKEGKETGKEGLEASVNIRKYQGFIDYDNSHEKQLIAWQHATHDRYVAEIMRGCTRGCRFCHAGFFYRPARERDPQQIIDHILHEVQEAGWEEAALVSLSSSDYTCIRPLLVSLHQQLKENKATISLPSLRVDSLDGELVQLINAVGKAGLTIAPEAGSQRLRNIINKNITEEEILEGVHIALENGWQTMKLYFMIGLPGEEESDIEAIIDLVEDVIAVSRKKLQINVSLSPFVPKPFTPFQWSGMLSPEKLLYRALLVKHALSRYRFVKVKYHEIESSMLEAVLTKGDEDTGKWMLEAYKLGAKFDGWHEYFNWDLYQQAALTLNYDWEKVLQPIPLDSKLPWDNINLGVSKDYLLKEWEHALNGQTTGDCKDGTCFDCGVCNADINIHIVGATGMVAPTTLTPGDGATMPVAPTSTPTTVATMPVAPTSTPTTVATMPVAPTTSTPTTGATMPVAPTQHYRVFYSKLGDLRFISHLDLMRMIFRLVRRNHLPVVYTQGYNPHPKISLGPPLPLGVEGEMEFFDMSVAGEISQEELALLLLKNFKGAVDFRALKLIGDSDKINWEKDGIEVLVIKPTSETSISFEERVNSFNQVKSFPITKIRHEKEITSELKDIILDMHWDNGVLYLTKKLRGAGVYDILSHVFGLERTQTYGMSIVRRKLRTKNEE